MRMANSASQMDALRAQISELTMSQEHSTQALTQATTSFELQQAVWQDKERAWLEEKASLILQSTAGRDSSTAVLCASVQVEPAVAHLDVSRQDIAHMTAHIEHINQEHATELAQVRTAAAQRESDLQSTIASLQAREQELEHTLQVIQETARQKHQQLESTTAESIALRAQLQSLESQSIEKDRTQTQDRCGFIGIKSTRPAWYW